MTNESTGQDQDSVGGQGSIDNAKDTSPIPTTVKPGDTGKIALNENRPAAADGGNEGIDTHVDQCLSMVLHHQEVAIMADIIKRVWRERHQNGERE